MIEYLRKNKVSIDDLPKLVEHLPSLGGGATKSQLDDEYQETQEVQHDEQVTD